MTGNRKSNPTSKQTKKQANMGASSSGANDRGANACPHTNGGQNAARKSIQEVAMISSQPPDSNAASSVPPANNTAQASGAKTIKSTSPANNLGLDQSAQLRSTLAIGQLIASNRPTAGSRLIANEVRLLGKAIREESANLRKEVANLSNNLATTLKRVLDDDREARSMGSTGGLARRPMFGSFAARRFPVFRRPRRPLQAIQRYQPTSSSSTNGTNGVSSPSESSPLAAPNNQVASKTASTSTQTPEVVTGTTQKQATIKLSSLAAAKSPTAMNAAKALALVFKGPWMTMDRSYDGEADSDSNETTPSSSP